MTDDQLIEKYMTLEQIQYLEKHDLWTAFDEISRDWDEEAIGDNNWEDYWELFVEFITIE